MEAYKIRPYETGEAGLICHLQMNIYKEEFGFHPIFEYYLIAGMADHLKDPTGGAMWVAEKDGRVIGSIAVVKAGETEAVLRWFMVEKDMRGKGIGTRLVETAMQFCADHGYDHIILWTAEMLHTAKRLYGKHGFQLTETKENTDWTDCLVLEEKWEYQK